MILLKLSFYIYNCLIVSYFVFFTICTTNALPQPPFMMMGPPAGFPMGGPPPPGLQMARPMPPPLVRKPPVIQQLVFEYGDIAPDNFVQKGILINQRFPGPPIRVQWLDTLIIDVTNNLDHGIALHFHGLRNYGESFSDGVPYITQEPIPPGGVFRYTINIGYQTGTFLYHLQSSVADQIWGFGPIIIEDGPELLANQPAYYHFWDHVLILSQCWHTAMSKLFKLEGPLNSEQAKYFKGFSSEPASILINGRSYGKWGKRNGLTEGYEVITVQPEKTYRLRVIGGGIDSILTFAIESHKMTIMEVDGTIIEPLEVDRLEVNSGQRYSILVTMDQEVGTYLITSEMIPGPGPNNGKAILQYEGAEVDVAKRTKVYKGNSTFEKLKRWEGSKLSPNPVIRQPDIYPLPKSVDREIVITMTRKKKTKEASDDDDDESEDDDKSDKKTKRDASPKSDDSHDTSYSYQVNGKSFKTGKVPLLTQVRNSGMNITKEPIIYETLTNQSIQFVFQNTASDEGICTQHAFHFHGHSFYVVGHGKGKYDEDKDGDKIDTKVDSGSPFVFRDVVTAYPEPEGDEDVTKLKPGQECGWTAVRIWTDNPGVWLFHCHLASHIAAGEGFVVYSHTKDDPRLKPPQSG